MIRRTLLAFAAGVLCTVLLVPLHDSGKRSAFEFEAWQHGAGYFEISVFDNRCIWHWWN